MIYFTSDLHFFHDRGFIYQPRGFSSIEEMNVFYVKLWKDTIKAEDDVYVLGDFCLGKDYNQISDLLKQLPGKIHLIIGNHDTDKKVEFYQACGIDAKYADKITNGKRTYYLSHYPTLVADLHSDPKQCVINLHGHIHTKERFYEDRPYLFNVSVDANSNQFVTFTKIEEAFEKKVNECYACL